LKPFVNLSEIEDYESSEEGPFKEKYSSVSDKIGACKLGYNLVILEPGGKACSFHNHHINEEMFLILEGSGTLRFGEDKFQITEGDIIACPPGGRELAHQIINTSNSILKYMALSTMESTEVCEYPDSNKVLSMVGEQGKRSFSHISRIDDAVDYYHGEK